MAIEKVSRLPLNSSCVDAIPFHSLTRRQDKVYKIGYDATVLFAQYECGGGICISPKGTILTCSHTLGNKPKRGIEKVIVFTNGKVVLTRAIEVDVKKDLALLSIIAEYDNTQKRFYPVKKTPKYPFVDISNEIKAKERVVCYGQPGVDDLEADADDGDVKTGYPVIARSSGKIEKLNFNETEFTHSAWTYWGHSGSALLNQDCKVVGIHVGWESDEEIRLAVHLNTIQSFLKSIDDDDKEEDDSETEHDQDTGKKRKRDTDKVEVLHQRKRYLGKRK